MKLTLDQYNKIKHALPVQWDNVEIDNLTLLNALLHITENGCKRRAMPDRFGKWNTVYRRVNRWAKRGVIERIFEATRRERILAVEVDFIALDSTSAKVHPDGTGAAKKNGRQSIGKSRGGRTTKIHPVAADDRTAVTLSLSGGNERDAPEGRKLIGRLG
ncbi:MAG: IS5 family transposase, partial [Synergistaceae bacterium]|nr:IS5 family transposase [Synergistaceae bacterium]